MDIKIFIRKTLIVLFSIFFILNLLGLLFDYQLRRSNVFKVNILFNMTLTENIILGSSRSLTGINTKLFSNLTNMHWYNLSMDDTKAETHLLFLKLLVNLKKTPKIVLLQYDRQNSQNDTSTFFDNDYQLLPFINTNDTINDYFRLKQNYSLFKFIPIYKYIYFNTELLFPCILTIFKPRYHHKFDDETGDFNYPNEYIMKDSTDKFENQQIILKNPVVKKLNIICVKEKADLYIYTAPIYHVKIFTDTNINHYFNFSDSYLHADFFSDNFHIAHNTKNDFTLRLSKIF